MFMKKLFFLSATLCMLSCKPKVDPPFPPTPPPNRAIKVNLSADSIKTRFTAFHGFEKVENGRLPLRSLSNTSAWMYLNLKVPRDSMLSFGCVVTPSADFAIGFTTQAFDPKAAHGFFFLDSRVRFYMYNGFPYRHFKRNKFVHEDTLSKTAVLTNPVRMELAFKNDRVFYVLNGYVVGSDTLGAEFKGDVALEISAYNTPRYGVAYLDSVFFSYYAMSALPPPPQNTSPETLRVYWFHNKERDLAFYRVKIYAPNQPPTFSVPLTDTSFVYLNSDSTVGFEVFAYDTAANQSLPSTRVQHFRDVNQRKETL